MHVLARVKGWPVILTAGELLPGEEAELLGIFDNEQEVAVALDEAMSREYERRRAN